MVGQLEQIRANAPPAVRQVSGKIRLARREAPQIPGVPEECNSLGALPGETVGTLYAVDDTMPEVSELGPNVELAADGVSIVATVAGIPMLNQNRLWIEPATVVPADAVTSTSSIDAPSHIIVRGSLVDLAKLQSGASIVVANTVDAPQIKCGGDFIVGGGIAGKEKGRCVVGGNLYARFATGAYLDVVGDTIVETEIVGCQVRCRGTVILEEGTILSGEVCGTAGIRCQNLGGASGARTIVEVAGDRVFFEEAAAQISDIDKTQAQIEKTRQLVEPLMANQKQLNAAQKEKATELLFQASELEERNNARLQAIRSAYSYIQEHSKAKIEVTGTVYPGAIIRFPLLEATISTPLRGPLCIMLQEQGHQRRIVLRSVGGHSVTPLESRPLISDAAQAVRRLLNRTASEVAA